MGKLVYFHLNNFISNPPTFLKILNRIAKYQLNIYVSNQYTGTGVPN